MKKLIICLLVLASYTANAQERSRSSFGLVAGTGYARILSTSSEDAPDLDLKRNLELGALFYKPLVEKLTLETGILYHYNRLTQSPVTQPNAPQISTYYDLHLLYLPVFLRINTSDHFFINGGLFADIDLSNPLGLGSSKILNSQSGIGGGVGIGGELEMSPKLYLQINPYLNFHGALLLKKENYQGSVFDTGIKIGIRMKH